MKYIYIINENFGFKDDLVNKILSTDIKIDDAIYNKFFELKSQGKQFKIKNINGLNFSAIFEEKVVEDITQIDAPTLASVIETVDSMLLMLL